MNTQSLLVLLPVLAFGACTQPESTAATTPAAETAAAAAAAATTAVTAVTAEVAVNQTVVLAITGAS